MSKEGKEIVQSLVEKLKAAVDEVRQIKETLLSSPEVGRVKDGLHRGARVVGDETSRIFEELGRETFELVKAGKISVPEAIRDTFEWAEKNLSRFSEEARQAAPDAQAQEPPAQEPKEQTEDKADGAAEGAVGEEQEAEAVEPPEAEPEEVEAEEEPSEAGESEAAIPDEDETDEAAANEPDA